MPSSSPTPVTTTSTQKSEPWSAQIPHLENIFKGAQDLYNRGPNTMYPGSFTAPTDPATTAGINATETRAMNGSPVLGAANNEMLKTIRGDYASPESNPYLSGIISRTAGEVLPRVNAGFANSGGPGGLQTRAATTALADSTNSLLYGNYNAEREKQFAAANAAPQFAAADYIDPQMLGAVGAAREGIAQKGIDENIARYDFNQNADADALARYKAFIEGNYGGTTSGTSTQYLPPQNILSQVLGGLMGGVGTLGQTGAFGKTGWMFSDERLKENIEPVGSTNAGLPLYKYNYIGDDTPQIGVMAQDVMEYLPSAVAKTPSGFLAVDYGQVR